MNSESFCMEFKSPTQGQSSGRRLSTSWDNDEKMFRGLAVPCFDRRRNSNTLAQLLEGYRTASLEHEQSSEIDDSPRSRPDSRRTSIAPRRHSVGSRRPSVAEMFVDNGVSKTTDDCVMVTQTLGSSNTYFFQKNPFAENLELRPSAVERGLYNFDNSIKDTPSSKYMGTPRPSIQLSQSPRPSTLSRVVTSINECEGKRTPRVEDVSFRPSLNERGLPGMKFTPVLPNGQLPCAPQGRTLHKKPPHADPRFDFELDKIIAIRRKIIDEEEKKRERLNRIRPRTGTVQENIGNSCQPHLFDGSSINQFQASNVMEELRNQMEKGEVDRIVKEKKTTTLSPTGVPVQNPNRKSITVEGSLPELLDRPYVRSQEGKQASPSVPMKTVTIRVPPDHQQGQRTSFHRSATPSPHNVRLLTAAEKTALRHNASKFEGKPATDHPLDDAADNCRQS